MASPLIPESVIEEFLFMVTDIMEAEGVTDFDMDEIMARGSAISDKHGGMAKALAAIPHARKAPA